MNVAFCFRLTPAKIVLRGFLALILFWKLPADAPRCIGPTWRRRISNGIFHRNLCHLRHRADRPGTRPPAGRFLGSW